MTDAVIIGGGPAGLMAAEVIAGAGHSVLVADQMPSLGRKFLMAGKSGLNLTKIEPEADFKAAFEPTSPALRKALADFGPAEVVEWAEGLGQSVFTGSTGRVFPDVMKASPLLRAWLRRLAERGVTVQTRMRWQGWEDDALVFDSPEGRVRQKPRATVLSLGGASWKRLGSDGAWATYFHAEVAPFAPANMGFVVHWSEHMQKHLGQPVKSVRLVAGDIQSRGEFIISERGVEGGGVYAVAKAMREGAPLTLDLLPDLDLEKVRVRLDRPRGKASLPNFLRKALGLDPARIALLQELGRPLPDDLAPLLKALPIRHAGPRPMDEAISTAGGLRFAALDDQLTSKTRPGVFCAGEMLDWEAPTGGYLITGCLATGRLAGLGAVAYLGQR